MTFEGLAERQAWVFAYVFAPVPIVGATGSQGIRSRCCRSIQERLANRNCRVRRQEPTCGCHPSNLQLGVGALVEPCLDRSRLLSGCEKLTSAAWECPFPAPVTRDAQAAAFRNAMRCPWGSQRRITVDRRVLSELLPPNIDLIAANRNVRFTSLCDVQYVRTCGNRPCDHH